MVASSRRFSGAGGGGPSAASTTPALGGGGRGGGFWCDRALLGGEAVESPQRLSSDLKLARRLLALVPEVPTPVWGRDELHAGEMWNSNSVVAWLLARAGLDAAAITPPTGGRAPGWASGLN